MGEIRNAYKVLVAKPEGKSCLEDLDVDERVLQWILKKQHGRVRNGLI
jgi:hypothetical protein